jgi:ankyrin repeat protein
MPHPLDKLGRSPLHYAALNADEKLTRAHVLDCDVNLHDKNGWTPLHFAAQSNAVECARILLEAGAEIDAVDAHGNTPLSTAVFNSKGFGDLILLLRSRGADPERKNSHGQTPIGLANLIANYEVKKFFSDSVN